MNKTVGARWKDTENVEVGKRRQMENLRESKEGDVNEGRHLDQFHHEKRQNARIVCLCRNEFREWMKVSHALLCSCCWDAAQSWFPFSWADPCTGIWWRVSECLEVGYDTTPITLVAHYANHVSPLTLHNWTISSMQLTLLELAWTWKQQAPPKWQQKI